jgi:cell division protein FtsW (lipid II flippase)
MTPATYQDQPNPQRIERWLLLLGAIFLGVNWLSLSLQRGYGLMDWSPYMVWLVCATAGHVVLARTLPRHDPLLLSSMMILSGWGLVTIDRLLPVFADRQAIWLILSMFALFVSAIFPQPMRWLRQYRYLFLVVGLVLLVSTILLGRNPSGAGPELWLGFGNIYFQPSELLKLILVGFLSSYLGEQYMSLRHNPIGERFIERNQWLSPRIMGPIVLMWAISVVILVWQRDLGTAILFFLIFLTLLYVASGQIWIMLSGFVLTLIAGIVAYFFFSVVALRIDIWLAPWAEADGRAYQIVQSLMAFGAGGIGGQGIGQGEPLYIPVVHSDFIFAAVAEEWGFLGIVAILVLVATLVLRGLKHASRHANRPFHAMFGIGLSMVLGIQSLMIMGGVLKVIPLTGVTLPFLSYGGSSLLISAIMIGFLLRLSHEAT